MMNDMEGRKKMNDRIGYHQGINMLFLFPESKNCPLDDVVRMAPESLRMSQILLKTNQTLKNIATLVPFFSECQEPL